MSTPAAILLSRARAGRRMLTVSRDGRWLLWSQVDVADSDLVLVENFR